MLMLFRLIFLDYYATLALQGFDHPAAATTIQDSLCIVVVNLNLPFKARGNWPFRYKIKMLW